MGSIIFILTLVLCLVVWDIQSKLMRYFNRKKYGEFWNDFFRTMSNSSKRLAEFYAGINFIHESAIPLETLPDKFILISNHQSLADIPILVSVFPKHDLKFSAKKELKYWIPSVSVGLRHGNHAFVTRRGSFRSTKRSFDRVLALPGPHITPVLFPEGTRSRDGELGKFHEAGARFLIGNSDLPVVSVAIDGGYKIRTFNDFLFIRGLQYRTKVLKVFPNVKGKNDISELLNTIKHDIQIQINDWRKQ
ncbi:MAG: 1-acyl-sn-glycerol-3-phosphate acyltransferase [Spirochaetales bacterium]|nr:1-acyl-sn-glycerol-3-phosphate acyltransferase [Spirochaetales bacterium]